jgi:heat shock protein HtpX
MNIYSQISSNKRKTILIMTLFLLFVLTLGYVYGKAYGDPLTFSLFAFTFSCLTSIGSYFFSEKVVLRISGAKQLRKEDNPRLYNLIENLCIGNGQPLPRIYVISDPSPNAFATGRDPAHSSICLTTGLLERLSKVELEGVIAHELSHIKNYDVRLMTVVAVLVGFVVILGEIFSRSLHLASGKRSKGSMVFLIIGLIFLLVSPLIATLIQLAVSRRREFLADASGALLTRYPEGLASALEKISAYPHPLRNATNATAHLFIENPFKGKREKHWLASLFNTHPPVEERIKILRSM